MRWFLLSKSVREAFSFVLIVQDVSTIKTLNAGTCHGTTDPVDESAPTVDYCYRRQHHHLGDGKQWQLVVLLLSGTCEFVHGEAC